MSIIDRPVLKRRLNPFLLVSTVLILSLLAGLSVLYQGQLNNLVTEKKELKKTLDEKRERISNLQKKNSNLSRELKNTESDLQKYIELYKSEKKQRKSLEDQIDDLKQNINELEARTNNLTRTITRLNDSLSDICDLTTENMTTAKTICRSEGHES